jgi:hypothetical protein
MILTRFFYSLTGETYYYDSATDCETRGSCAYYFENENCVIPRPCFGFKYSVKSKDGFISIVDCGHKFTRLYSSTPIEKPKLTFYQLE